MSTSLKLQKRLAASILGCGKKRVWMDPTEIREISLANSRANVRKLIRDGFIIRRPERLRSRARVRKIHEAKRKGRHMGIGKRKGTREARMPSKRLWMCRIRVQRRILRRFRATHKIDRHQYRVLYMKAKGNVYRNKRVLIEAVNKMLAEQALASRKGNVADQKKALAKKAEEAKKADAKKALAKKAEEAKKVEAKKAVEKKAEKPVEKKAPAKKVAEKPAAKTAAKPAAKKPKTK